MKKYQSVNLSDVVKSLRFTSEDDVHWVASGICEYQIVVVKDNDLNTYKCIIPFFGDVVTSLHSTRTSAMIHCAKHHVSKIKKWLKPNVRAWKR